VKKKKGTSKRNIFRPDKHRLDEEWEDQPLLMRDHTRAEAEAERKKDTLKAQMAVLEAELRKKIARNPAKYGLGNEKAPSEAAINRVLPLQQEHKDLTAAIIEAQYELNVISGAVRALVDKKKALECLVELHARAYFAEPRASDDASRVVADEARMRRRRKENRETQG